MLRNLTTQRARRTAAEVAEQKTFHGKAGNATCEEPGEVLVEFLRGELRGVSWRSLRLEAVVLRRTRNHWFETAPFPRASAFALALVTSACDRLPGHPQYFVFLALRCAENRPLEVVVDGPRSSGCYLVDHLRQHIFLHLASLVAPDRRVGGCGWHRSPVHLLLHRVGHRVRAGAMFARTFCVDVPR